MISRRLPNFINHNLKKKSVTISVSGHRTIKKITIFVIVVNCKYYVVIYILEHLCNVI